MQKFLLFLFCFSLLHCTAKSSYLTFEQTDIEYINPKPGSNYATPQHSLTIRPGKMLQKNQLNMAKFKLSGSVSGEINFNKKLALDNRSIIIEPQQKFKFGETVSVWIDDLHVNDELISVGYDFRIVNKPYKFNDTHGSYKIPEPPKLTAIKDSVKITSIDSVPVINYEIIDEEKLAPGNYFFPPITVWSPPKNRKYNNSIFITDNYGQPLYWEGFKTDSNSVIITDFKLQHNGQLSYFDLKLNKYYILNSKMEIVDSAVIQNTPYTDFHGLQILPNGNRTLMSYPKRKIDMSEYNTGGPDSILYTGAMVQEQDANGNVLFEWWSFVEIDPMQTTPARYDPAKDSTLDGIHINSIEKVADGYLLSLRNIDEIVKISRKTGEIMWRCGLPPNNEFEFISEVSGEPAHFSGQHDVRLLDNGRISLFDNGVYIEAPEDYSRGCEYEIDIKNKKMTLVEVFVPEERDIWGRFMGNMQTLPNGSKIVGWGTGTPNLSEFAPDGSLVSNISFNGVCYRAFKFEMQPELLVPEYDNVNISVKRPVFKKDFSVFIRNNTKDTLILNNFNFRNTNYFEVKNKNVRIEPHSSSPVEITFDYRGDTTENVFINEVLTVAHYGEKIIGTQIGISAKVLTSIQNISEIETLKIQPNPVRENAELKLFLNNTANLDIDLYDLNGEHLKTIENTLLTKGMQNIEINTTGLKNGVYLLKITGKKGQNVLKFIVNK